MPEDRIEVTEVTRIRVTEVTRTRMYGPVSHVGEQFLGKDNPSSEHAAAASFHALEDHVDTELEHGLVVEYLDNITSFKGAGGVPNRERRWLGPAGWSRALARRTGPGVYLRRSQSTQCRSI